MGYLSFLVTEETDEHLQYLQDITKKKDSIEVTILALRILNWVIAMQTRGWIIVAEPSEQASVDDKNAEQLELVNYVQDPVLAKAVFKNAEIYNAIILKQIV